jgi:hypothetical protein
MATRSMAEPNRPVNLYPPDLLPTAQMTKVFNPERIRPWQRPIVQQQQLHQQQQQQNLVQHQSLPPMPQPTVPLHGVTLPYVSDIPVYEPPVASVLYGTTIRPLRPEQVDGILAMVRARPDNHPYRPTSAGRVGSLMSGLFGATRPADITLKWLNTQHVTLRELLTTAGLRVSITDLISAGIVRTLGDLLALDFRAADLTLRRDCFNCSHFVQFFNGNYRLLSDTSACGGFTMQTLLEATPRFTCDDLMTLGVTAQHLVLDDDGGPIRGFDFKLLGVLELGPADWVQLGLESIHLKAYGITAEAARRKLFWDPQEVARVFDMPKEWLK